MCRRFGGNVFPLALLAVVFGCSKPPPPGSLRRAAESFTSRLNQNANDELTSEGEVVVVSEKNLQPSAPTKLGEGDEIVIRNVVEVAQEKIEYRLGEVEEQTEMEDSERYSYGGSILLSRLSFKRSLELRGDAFHADVPSAWPLIDDDQRGQRYKKLCLSQWVPLAESAESVRRRAIDKLKDEPWSKSNVEEKRIELNFDKETRLWCHRDEPIPILEYEDVSADESDAAAVRLRYHEGEKLTSDQILAQEQTAKGLRRTLKGWTFPHNDLLDSNRVLVPRMIDSKGNHYQSVHATAVFKDGLLVRHSSGLKYLNRNDFPRRYRGQFDDLRKSVGRERVLDDETLKNLKIYLDNKRRMKKIKKPSDEKIIEEIRREARRLVNLRYNEAEKRRTLERFNQHVKPLESGDEITVTYRYGAKWRELTGPFRGSNGQKIIVGDTEIPIFDISKDISSRLNQSEQAINSMRNVYMMDHFHIPKAKFHREMLGKVKKEVSEKYGCDPSLFNDKSILHDSPSD